MTTCTGTRYHVNPDAPDEGSDIHHDGPCPTHDPICEGCNRPAPFVNTRHPSPDDDFFVNVGPCCDPTVEPPLPPQ